MDEYGLPREHPGPIVARIEDPSFFLAGQAPSPGCAFWIVEHPAYGFFGDNKEKPRHFPRTVRELAQAIVSCTVSPEEYRRVVDEAGIAAKERAEKLKDDPAQRERLLASANAKLPEDYAGKYVCRVVYFYPNGVGTMTTQMRMAKADLDKLRDFLKDPQSPVK